MKELMMMQKSALEDAKERNELLKSFTDVLNESLVHQRKELC